MTVDLKFTAERIRRLRERLEMTQAQFAEAAGVAQSTISLWESGERRPEGADVLASLLDLEQRERTAV